MPTLFARRYMRDGPPPTERLIGVVCLAITAVIAVSFIAYARTSRQPFFSVDPKDQPRAISPETKHALSLLPDSPAPGWVRGADDPRAVAPADMVRSIPDKAPVFAKAGARRMYETRYRNMLDDRQQLAVRVFDMGTPQAARAVFDSTRPATAVGEPVGVRGWRNGETEVGFQSGRYFTSITATNLPADASLTPRLLAREVADRQVAFDVPVAATTADQASQKPAVAPAAATALLPSVPGGAWSAPQQISTYNPGNLWEKIDGRAEQYLAFEFERLIFGTYRLAADPGSAVDCYIYEMRDPLKAYGIYQAERSGHPQELKVGKEGYRGKGTIFFIKGKAYVQLIAAEDAKVADEQTLQLAEAIAGSIKDEGGGNWAEDVLPKQDLVAGSFSYQPKNAFNLDFLNDVFAAEYEAGDVHMVLFVHRAENAAAAKKLFEEYAEYVPKQGKVVEKAESAGGETLIADFGGEYDIIFYKGSYFAGANAASSLPAAKKRIGELRDALKD